MDRTLNGLLFSRKFWLAVFGVVTAIVAEYINVPADIWISIEVLILAVIASITIEDAAEKRSQSGSADAPDDESWD